jgi:hypothetical protein
VFVVDVAIPLLLSGPAKFVIAARWLGALEWSRVGLLMLGQVARTLEFLAARRADMHDVSSLVGLATAGHGPIDIIIIRVLVARERTFRRHSLF